MTTIVGRIKEIGSLEQIRRTTKPDIYKKLISIIQEDGQVFYGEIRNNNIKILEREGLELGDEVTVNILFQGNEKDGKKYNNILIHSIQRLVK